MRDLRELVKNGFRDRKIAIVGDLIADQFLHGTISRVSREAPVFILSHDSTDTRAGGAGNAAVNVASLCGRPLLVGLVGNDTNGALLTDTLTRSGVDISGIVQSSYIQTTTKVRVLAGQHYAARQQVIRIDYENSGSVGDDHARSLLIKNLPDTCSEADAIILSDYDYGVVDTAVFETAKEIASERKIPLLVDSRSRLAEFKGVTTATPNSDEVEHILGKGFTDRQCSELRERLGLEALLITRGNKGMRLFERGKEMSEIDAVGPSEPVDVTGAGDTVIAAYALGLASGMGYYEAARLANHAGGIVVMKKGTASVTSEELLASLEENAAAGLSESSNA